MNGLSDSITLLFVAATICGVIGMWWKKKNPSLISNYSSTLGVLGTFVGIFIGLLDFDVLNIQGSVPALLGGLKTAFVTSIVGMTCSMIVKLFYKVDKNEVYSSPEFEQGTEIKKELAYLVELMKDVRRILSDNDTSMKISSLQESMEGGFKDMDISNKSLVSEIKGSIESGVKNLDDSINKFGKVVAEQSSKELIESIQKVMDDFNTKINNQLGESFKELTVSVTQLNEWQKNHVELLKSMEDYESKLVGFIQRTIGLMNEFNENCEGFKKNEEELSESNRKLSELIIKVKSVGDEFENTMPTIEQRMNKAMDCLANLVNEYDQMTKLNIHSLTEGKRTMEENNKRLREDIGKIHGSMNDAMIQFSTHLNGVLRKFNEDINNRAAR